MEEGKRRKKGRKKEVKVGEMTQRGKGPATRPDPEFNLPAPHGKRRK